MKASLVETEKPKINVWERFANSPGFNLEKKLGNITLPPAPVSPISYVKYTFHTEDSEDNLIFTGSSNNDGHPVIKGANLEKLVERLTYEQYHDPGLTQTFLLTYRTFTTPLQLLNILIARYNTEPRAGMSQGEWEAIIKPIRLRVFNVLKNWLLKGFYDFSDNVHVQKAFINFIATQMEVDMNQAANQLITIFDRQMSEAQKIGEIVFSHPPPKPIVPKVFPSEPSALDFHPEELARQLTLIESELYRAIKPWEFLNQAWAKKDKFKRAPRIMALIDRFNLVSKWVATEILHCNVLKNRVSVMRHFIEVAHKCLSLNNLNCVMEIVSGLHTSPVFRLKQTWAALGSRHTKMIEECSGVVNREQSYKAFRAYLHSIDPPAIPYLGVYLTDLTFIEDGNPDMLAGGLINFVKRQQVSQVINEIVQYQLKPYNLQIVPEIREFLMHIKAIEDEKEMFSLSTEIEPRVNGSVRVKPAISKRAAKPIASQVPDSPRFGEFVFDKTYKFGDPDTSLNVLFNDNSQLHAGTIPKLLEKIISEVSCDTVMFSAFLMSFRTFTTSSQVLDLLIMRFSHPEPINASKEIMKTFTYKKQVPLQIHSLQALKIWIDSYPSDFREDTVLIQRVLDFLDRTKTPNSAVTQVIANVRDALLKIDASVTAWVKPLRLGESSALEISWNILDYDPADIAQHVYNHTLASYQGISSRECMNQFWNTSQGSIRCPNLWVIVSHNKWLQNWMMAEVYHASSTQTRAKCVGFFLNLANRFAMLHDFHDCQVIYHTLETNRNFSLRSTWDWLSVEDLRIWNWLQKLSAKGNNLEISVGDVVIPYLTPFINSLESLHQNLPDRVGDLINFSKFRKLHGIFTKMRSFVVNTVVRRANTIIGNVRVNELMQMIPTFPDTYLVEARRAVVEEAPTSFSIEDTPSAKVLNTKLMEMISKDARFSSMLAWWMQQDSIVDIFSEFVEKELIEPLEFIDHRVELLICSQLGDLEGCLKHAYQIAKSQFPSHTLNTWAKPLCDQGELVRFITASLDDEFLVIDVRTSVSPAELNLLQQHLNFFNSQENLCAKLTLILADVDHRSLELANTLGFDVCLV